jgi:hypothetical protein
VVGAYFGNPELGFALGSLAGSALFPTQLPRGPQLTDNRTTTADLGEPCPIGFGTFSVAGTVILLAPSVQSTNEQGGKGGPEQLTYQYNQSIGIALVESAIDLQQAIGGVSRIWENGTLVYDIRPQQAANTQTGTVAETDEQYSQRLAGSAVYAETFVLYLGSEDQEPDPTFEALYGVGNLQPFKGLAYIVYPNRLLQTAQGWRHPNFQFECFTSGAGDCTEANSSSNWFLAPWGNPGNQGELDPRDPTGTYQYQAFYFDEGFVNPVGDVVTMLDAAIAIGGYQAKLYGWSANANAVHGIFPGSPVMNEDGTNLGAEPAGEFLSVNMFYNQNVSTSVHFDILPNDDPATECEFVGANDMMMWMGGVDHGGGDIGSAGNGVYTIATSLSGRWQGSSDCGGDPDTHVFFFTNDMVKVTRTLGIPAPVCYGLPVAPLPGYCILDNGDYQLSAPWVLDTVNEYLALANLGVALDVVVQYPLNPCILVSDASNTEAFWTAAYEAAVAAGTMPSGYTYGSQYPVTPTNNGVNGAWAVESQICTGAGSSVSVADIITCACQRAGVTDIDVSDMEAITVDGYQVSALSSASDVINPLRSVAFFDSVESGLTIRFQSRGKALVATLGADDIGAFDATSAGEAVPPSVTALRSLDSDLPRRIRYHYIATERDYQAGEQDSPFRPTTIAVNDQDVSIPIAMSDTQALQAAEVLWADAWNGRTTYTVNVGAEWAQLEGGDPIAIPVNGFTVRVRIIKDQNSGGVLRVLTCVSDDDRSYTSVAIAPPSTFVPPVLVVISATELYLMDLPALQDADASAGFYTAVMRTWAAGNTFRGATLYRSTNGGSTWVTQYSQTVESEAGILSVAVSSSQAYTWDTETVIEVTLPSDTLSFESISDDAVLAGGNAAAMGANQRWEIVQFATATKVATAQWQLSRLLRGRRGTEWAIGRSQVNDSFVMLATGALARITLNIADIGNLDDYEGVSIGASFSTGVPEAFTGRGVALKPFSPVDIDARYQTDGDILITWTRRDKLGRTLMDGVDIPNSEATLAFQVDVISLDSGGTTVLRTIAVTDVQALYTAAQIMTDFGTSAPSELRVNIYQMSAVVGRGTPGQATINLGASS